MSVLFAGEVKPQTIEQGGHKYQAGQLTYIGRRSISALLNTVRLYLKGKYNWTQEKHDKMPRSVQGIANIMTDTPFLIVLGCDYTEELTPEQLFDWGEDFTDECFKLALELNPKLKVRQEGDEEPDTGKAQRGTHNEDGTPKTEAEVAENPLG